jgi:hypothetical protein
MSHTVQHEMLQSEEMDPSEQQANITFFMFLKIKNGNIPGDSVYGKQITS